MTKLAKITGRKAHSDVNHRTPVVMDWSADTLSSRPATWVLWFTSLCAFLPVIFSNLVVWLRGDDDADEALYRLVRDGRRRSGPLHGGDGPEVAGGRPTSTG